MSGNVFALHSGEMRRDLLDASAPAQILLGALLSRLDLIDSVPAMLLAEDFADQAHADVFRALRALREAGKSGPAIPLVWEALRGTIESGVLVDLTKAMVSNQPSYVAQMGDLVLRMSGRRQLRTLHREGMEATERGDMAEPTTVLVAQTQAHLEQIGGAALAQRPAVMLGAAMRDALEAADRVASGEIVGVSTGMASVDEALGYIEPGAMVILAGRPGMGKSALGLQWAVNAARAGAPTLFFSFEMSARELGRRVLSAASGVPVAVIKRGRHAGSLGALLAAERDLAGLDVAIEDASGQTPSMMAVKARAWQRRWGRLGLIVVDHLHIARPEAGAERHGGTYAVGQVSNALKRLAKDLEVPVLALAQLNRGVESRDEKRPSLGDLRQSGEIEQDADQVCFVHRPEYYLPKAEPEAKPGEPGDKLMQRRQDWGRQREQLHGKAELLIEKSRDGQPGMVSLLFDGPTTSFSEPALMMPGEDRWS